MKQLSIIIPHYNSINYLKRLLKSIPNNDEIEVLVIDDNSTKDKEQYNKLKFKYNHTNIHFLRNDTGVQSAGKCRNIGLQVAKGKWILFADADDFFLDGFYGKITQYNDSDYDVIHFTPTSVYNDTNQISNRHIPYEKLVIDYLQNDNLQNELKLRYSYGVPWSKLIKKELIFSNKIKFDEVLTRNDKLFSTKVGFNMKKFHATQEKIYCVTRNKGSLTMLMSDEAHSSALDVFVRNYNFLRENLSHKEIKLLKLSGFSILIDTFKAKLGFKKVLETYKVLKENKVKIIDNRYFNPFFIFDRVRSVIKTHFSERKYHIK